MDRRRFLSTAPLALAASSLMTENDTQEVQTANQREEVTGPLVPDITDGELNQVLISDSLMSLQNEYLSRLCKTIRRDAGALAAREGTPDFRGFTRVTEEHILRALRHNLQRTDLLDELANA